MNMNFRFIFFIFIVLLPFFQLFAQDDLKIKQVKFQGNDSITSAALLQHMNTKPRSLVDKSEFWKSNSSFSENILNEDVKRLKKHYQKNGFLDPHIKVDLVPNKRNKKVRITINIEEGVPVYVGKITFQSNDGANGDMLDSLKPLIPLRSGHRFRDEEVLLTEKKIKAFYIDRGYPHPKVASHITLHEGLSTADVDVSINAGEKAYFGAVTLVGDSLIPRTYIDKRIPIKAGDLYSQTQLDKTQQALFNTGLFKYVTLKMELDSTKNATIPIMIQVKEMPRWSSKVGVGYGTEDRVRLSLLMTRLNFFGGGRTFIFKGQRSYFVPLGLDAKFIQPDVLVKDLDLVFNPFLSFEHEESYDVQRFGTTLTFQKNFMDKSSAYLTYNLGLDKVELSGTSLTVLEEAQLSEKNNKSGLTLGYKQDKTNDQFSPSKGWKFNMLSTYMGLGFNSQYHYYKLIAEGDFFFPLSKEWVFACKLKGGIIQPVQGDSSSPIEDRFLMGGALSLRGWGRNQISPLNEDGVKIGGNTMLESSLELRFPIFRVLSGTAFVDFGNVWEDAWQYDLGAMNYDVGLGLRVSSPVGPIRFDVATPFINQGFSAQFFVSIGHAF